MAPSQNQRLADALLARTVQVARVQAALRQEAWAILARLEADLLAALKDADPPALGLLARRRRAVETLMDAVGDPLITTRYARLSALLTAALLRLACDEARQTRDRVTTAAEDAVAPSLPSAATLRRVVEDTRIPTPSRPTELSAPGAEWWTRQAASLQQRVRDQWLVSVSLEESLTAMAARLRGTADLDFADGMMARARTDAARLVQTQVTNAVSEARVAVADTTTQGLVLQHSAILDSRTSLICLGRDGLRYTVPDHDPIGHSVPYLTGAPYHPNCRSTMLVLLADGGPVAPESLTAWVRRQDGAMQDALLGPTRARMLRGGRLTPHALLDSATGRPLTLAELGA
jgi:hypothetical protein